MELFVLHPHEGTSDVCLEQTYNAGQTFIAHVFKVSQDTGFEEDLGVTDLVVVGVDLDGAEALLSGNLGINKALGHGAGGQDGVIDCLRVFVHTLCTDEMVWKALDFFFLPPPPLASSRVPTRGSFESDRSATTVSFRGSLFFSSQLVMLYGT
ncbi:hypothetical protein MAR_035731 [Mya arenaria]|uniref:Uncharacterized protein n=1 Tax=Mya arenaria TaxID=6604 RepID=A0ABY7EKZ9_MYAAR|nr:hypothetical protein MAR_035731 [Mya arenaria]